MEMGEFRILLLVILNIIYQYLNVDTRFMLSGEGNGDPLQYSCLESPMDGGDWLAAVHGVAELDMTEPLPFHFSLSCTGEGNGNPIPVFLPGESQGRRSLVGCHLWGSAESDTTEATQQQQLVYYPRCRQ